MFTGLIEATGEVTARTPTTGGQRISVRSALTADLNLGDSVAVNGVCLTVVETDGAFHADVGPETLRVTTLGSLATGAVVNLERPLRGDGRMGGHFVQGHVDAIGRIEKLQPASDFLWMTVSFPRELARFLVLKGSVAVDGISLTVAGLSGDAFDVQLVPFTMEHTNLKRARVGDSVNLECDMIGKYVARAAELILKP
jgi:riboflavin synthase